MEKLLKLQNGSDIRGVAISTDKQDAMLTGEAVSAIAIGLVNWLCQKTEKSHFKIGVGRDSRLSGPKLKKIFCETLVDYGCEVIDFGLATTPALFMSTQFEAFSCDASVMLTASHLPYEYNGVKIFSKDGGAEKEDIRFILTHSQKEASLTKGKLAQADLLTPYANHLVNKISRKKVETPLSNMKIIVDAGNGAGGFFAEKVLQPLGADTSGSQFLEPDGHFPNHVPNPDNKEAMASIQKQTLATGADLGIIFDTDVDRAAVVTKTGEILNRNNLIAVLSQIVLSEHPGTSIVTNSPTSDHLKAFIEAKGGHQVRYISGYRNVINKAISLNEQGIDCQLAIETSGHAAFKENYFLDDGAYVIAKILMLLPQLQEKGESLDHLIADLKQPEETQEVRFFLDEENFRGLGEKVIQDLAKWPVKGWIVDRENEEGVRFKTSTPFGTGWFLLRLSLHEPLLVLQVEMDESGKIRQVLEKIHLFLKTYPTVDQKKLEILLNEIESGKN